jgi:predicted ATP-grasp superfamily ATP-dependent carboligase
LSDGPLLIVGLSGRALAQSASRGDLRAVVIDAFGDEDTHAFAEAVYTAELVRANGPWRFDQRSLRAAVRTACQRHGCTQVLLGSGFEGSPELLDMLGKDLTLMGNRAAVVGRLKNPRRLSAALRAAGLSCPDTRLHPPRNPSGWLVKTLGGSGGYGIAMASAKERSAGRYWQRFVEGDPCSATFLANGQKARLLGINRQWHAPAPGLPFRYGGAIAHQRLPAARERELAQALDTLVAQTGLVGLNGLDLIWDGGRLTAIEINPRPPATFELYDEDFQRGLVAAHLAACRGHLPDSTPSSRVIRAHAVVHIAEPGQIPAKFAFPADCRDRPALPRCFKAGEPLCTLLVQGATPAATLARLRRALEQLRRL